MRETVSPVFAGRVDELGVLAGAFDDAVDGTPGAVLVGAEAGGGKSRLVRELVVQVGDRALVLQGGCVELTEAGLPYAPFVAVLRELVRRLGAGEVGALVDGAGELAWLLPDFGATPSGGDPGMARARLFEVLLRLFERLAERRPLVLVVEDMHWADPATRDLLSFLAGNLSHAPVLLIATYRSEELRGGHPLRPLLAQLDRMPGVTRLNLARLSRREVEAQLTGILGQAPEPALVGAVYGRGDGVPLFTEAMVGPGGTLRSGLPGSLRDLLLGVVKELPEPTQQVLRAAAVGGVRVGHALLTEVTGFGDAALTTALRPAATANVLVGDGDGYAFRHGLIREAVEEDLLAGERVQLHRAYAEALGPDRHPAALALHWRGANEPELALRAAWRAAAEAVAGLAYAEQLRMLDQVLDLWDRVPDAARHTGTDHVGVVELAADAACWAVEPERGLEHAQAALDEFDEERDGERIAAMLLQRAALRQQGLLPGHVDDLWTALDLARRPNRLRAETLGQLCRALMNQDRGAEAGPPAAELSELADDLGDEEYRLEALITRAQLGTRAGEDTTEALLAALDTAARIGSGRLEVIAYVGLTQALESRGDHLRAIETGRTGLARTARLGQTRYLGSTIAGSVAWSLTAAGRWDEALEIVDEALTLGPAPFGRAYLLLCRGEIAVARGDLPAAARVVQELAALPAETRYTLPLARLKIEHRLADGDPAGALAVPVPVVEGAEPRHVWPLLASAMRARAEAGRPEGTEDLARAAAEVGRPGPVERAYAALFAAEASGDPAAWDTAAGAWADLGRPYPQAYALLRAAAGDRNGAATRLPRAADLAGEVGAEPLLERIRLLARRMRIELSGARPAPETPFRLTGRELEVLRLVAAGRSNREIAAELFISAKTASVHVSNILGKLGVPTRGAAAAAAHRLQLFDAGIP